MVVGVPHRPTRGMSLCLLTAEGIQHCFLVRFICTFEFLCLCIFSQLQLQKIIFCREKNSYLFPHSCLLRMKMSCIGQKIFALNIKISQYMRTKYKQKYEFSRPCCEYESCMSVCPLRPTVKTTSDLEQQN